MLKIKFHDHLIFYLSSLRRSVDDFLGGWGRGVKNLGNGWSKSIVLENKVAINFDFRSGAKKSGHLDYPLQRYGPKIVNMPKYGLN